MFFKKWRNKKYEPVRCIDFSAMEISTGQISWYIKQLYQAHNFKHIAYDFQNIDGNCRFVIYTPWYNKGVIQYFKDRCPAMVEQECMQAPECKFMTGTWEDWNGQTEII